MTSFNFTNEQLSDARRFLRTHKSRILGPAAIVLLGLGGQMATHVVQRGDTLYSLAKGEGVTVEALATANNISNPNLIVTGQKLTLPESTDITIVVQPGDTVWSLAAAHGVAIATIIERNDLSASARIIEGQHLRIPATGGSASADVASARTWEEKKAAREARRSEQAAKAKAKAEANAKAAKRAEEKAEKKQAKKDKKAAKAAAAEDAAEKEKPAENPEPESQDVPVEEQQEEKPAAEPEPKPEPEKKKAAPAGVVTTIYVVQQGDSVASIASLFGIDAQLLADSNGISVDTPLDAGSRLDIPSR